MNISKNKQIIIGIIIIILLAVIGFFIFKGSKKMDSDVSKSQNNNLSGDEGGAIKPVTLYVNEKYGYKIFYPESWTIIDGDLANVMVSKKNGENIEASVSIATIDVGRDSVFDDDTKAKTEKISFLGRIWRSFVCPEIDTCLEQFAHRKHLRLVEHPASWGALNQISLDVYKGPGQEKLIQEAEKIIASFELRSE